MPDRTSSGRRPPWGRVCLATAALWVAWPVLASAAVRLIESDAGHAVLEIAPEAPETERLTGPGGEYVRVRMPGTGMTEEEGRPEVPVGSALIAVPPGTVPVLRVVGAQWSASRPGAITPLPARVAISDPFGADRVEEQPPVETALYRSAGTYPARPFALSEMRDLRGMRVVNVIWHGVQADVAARSHRVLESAVLEVTFRPDARRSAEPRTRPAPPDGRWQRARRGTVMNHAAAAGWARGGPGDAVSVGDTPWGGGDQVRLRIASTGPVRIPYATLAQAGFPANVPVDEVSVYQRTFLTDSVDVATAPAASLFAPIRVPVLVRDDGNGVFDGSDSILLYARSFRDQWMTSGWEHEDLFQTDNFYWVRADPGGGARMAVRPAQPAGAAADSLTSTPSRVFRESDIFYMTSPGDFGPGIGEFESEFYYWNNLRTILDEQTGCWSFPTPDPFTVTDLVPGSAATLLARVCAGGRPLHSNFTTVASYDVNGTTLGQNQFYNSSLYGAGGVIDPSRVLFTHPIPGGVLQEGLNGFTFQGCSYLGQSTINPEAVARFLFDWYQITYQRQLVARNGSILVNTVNGTPAPQRIRARGFGGSDIVLLDVSQPGQPAEVAVDPTQVVSAGGGQFDLRFGHDNTTGNGIYVALREAGIPTVPAADLTLVGPPTLLAGGIGAEWVAVAHENFLAGTEALAVHRAGKHTTLVVPLQEVWDVFGNGARHPDALRDFVAYAYHRWVEPPGFLLLVGDASEDHRGVGADADPDFLPSHSLWAQYEGAPEESDQFFAEVTRATPGVGPFDDLVDLFVGRLSVGTPEEMEWNVDRIVRYETEDLDGVWRKRAVFLADDAFSGSLGGGISTPYGFVRGEKNFCIFSQKYVDSMAAHPYDPLLPDLLCMSAWSHPCEDSCYECSGFLCDPDTISTCAAESCGIWYQCRTPDSNLPNEWVGEYDCMRERVKNAVLPALRSRLDDGVLVWNFEGHANRFFLTHENVFRDDQFRHDVDGLANFGKPFILVGFACHLAEFDQDDEAVQDDCMSEKLMNLRQPGATIPGGAIASFSSSGFEFLTPNLTFNEHLIDAFYYPERAADPGNLSGGGASLPPPVTDGNYVWTLGESTTRARLMHQADYPGSGQTRQASQRFILLGDPALEPNVGSPVLSATVNGVEVEDPRNGYFLDPETAPEKVVVTVSVQDGRGVASMRIEDSAQGEIPASAYQVAVDDSSGDGVVLRRTLTYTFSPRQEDYTLFFRGTDGSGATATFPLLVTNRFEFSGGEPAAYPSPFTDETYLFYRLTNQAQNVRVSVYTVTGRRILDLEEGVRDPNVQHRVRWDGHDERGQPVANGTYFLRFVVSGEDRELSRIIPVVKMR